MVKRFSFWEEMKRMQEEMDRLFDNFFSFRNKNLLESSSNELVNYKEPSADIWETDKNVMVEVEIPGVDKKDIQVKIDESGIDIKAEKKSEIKQEDKKKGMYRFERSYGGFYRHFSLPSNVNVDDAKAEYKDGLLKIEIPRLKIKEDKKKKLLEIK